MRVEILGAGRSGEQPLGCAVARSLVDDGIETGFVEAELRVHILVDRGVAALFSSSITLLHTILIILELRGLHDGIDAAVQAQGMVVELVF